MAMASHHAALGFRRRSCGSEGGALRGDCVLAIESTLVSGWWVKRRGRPGGELPPAPLGGPSSVRDRHVVVYRCDSRRCPGGVDCLVVLGPGADGALERHGAVVGRDVQVVRVERGIALERLPNRLLHVAAVWRRILELD